MPYVAIEAPASDAIVPANSLVWMYSLCGGSSDEILVRVDGEPASLVVELGLWTVVGYRIEPEPSPGATVELSGCPGYDSCEQALEEGGEDALLGKVELTFKVGARDDEAPAAPLLRGLDYVIEEEIESPCGSGDPVPVRDWSFTVDGQAEEQPLVYHMSLGPRGGDEPTQSHLVAMNGQEDLAQSLLRFQEDAGSDVCLTVRTFDLAGNEAEEVSACEKLGRLEKLDGCACASGSGRPGWSAALLLLAVWTRRRRPR